MTLGNLPSLNEYWGLRDSMVHMTFVFQTVNLGLMLGTVYVSQTLP